MPYCENCGREITKEILEENSGLCEQCTEEIEQQFIYQDMDFEEELEEDNKTPLSFAARQTNDL